jgi:Right handed beta helix region
MSRSNFTLRILAFAAFTLALTSMAQAQATRTWVSGVGDDVNPCSRTAPCKTFAGAISKTMVNGEISVLDPAGYSAVTITKSITIDGTGGYGSILASGVSGVTVNMSLIDGSDPLHVVRLRNLNINGAGSGGLTGGGATIGTRTGLDGIRVLTGSGVDPTVIVEETVIDGFTQSGIDWTSTGGNLIVKNCSIRNNTLHGIFVDSASTVVNVSIDNTTADFNQEGFRFDDNVRGTITRSRASHNLNGFVCLPGGAGNSEMNVDGSTASHNTQWGMVAGSTGAFSGTIRLSNSNVTNNTTLGLEISGAGQILSTGKNRITAPTDAPGVFVEQ